MGADDVANESAAGCLEIIGKYLEGTRYIERGYRPRRKIGRDSTTLSVACG